MSAIGDPDSGPSRADEAQQRANGLGKRPPRAVIGSQVSFEEEMFAAAFDGVVMRRFWAFVRPYKKMLWLGVGSVLVFIFSQLAIPLLVRAAIDHALVADEGAVDRLQWIGGLFIGVVCVNYAANIIQELVVGRIAGSLLFDLRRAMYEHLQHVSLSFMDRTEVGRLMSRLQGDVGALQEFLETSIFAIGDLVLLLGIVSVMLWLDPWLGLLTLSVVPVPGARGLVAVRAAGFLARPRDAIDHQWRAGGERARHSDHPGIRPRTSQLRAVHRQGTRELALTPARLEVFQWPHSDRRCLNR